MPLQMYREYNWVAYIVGPVHHGSTSTTWYVTMTVSGGPVLHLNVMYNHCPRWLLPELRILPFSPPCTSNKTPLGLYNVPASIGVDVAVME